MADTDNKENERPPIDVTPSSLHQVEPTWRTDGYGVRGPQDEKRPESVNPTPMDFDASYPHEGGGGGGSESCKPPGGDEGKTYARITKFQNGKWKCQWAEVCS